MMDATASQAIGIRRKSMQPCLTPGATVPVFGWDLAGLESPERLWTKPLKALSSVQSRRQRDSPVALAAPPV
jgi:hypothetical protein